MRGIEKEERVRQGGKVEWCMLGGGEQRMRGSCFCLPPGRTMGEGMEMGIR